MKKLLITNQMKEHLIKFKYKLKIINQLMIQLRSKSINFNYMNVLVIFLLINTSSSFPLIKRDSKIDEIKLGNYII